MNQGAFSNVTIVVVTYNSAHCLPMLAPLLSVCPNVVISDNGSDDDTAVKAQTLWPQAKVLAHGRNLGFGAANNRALALVKTQDELDRLLDQLDREVPFPPAAQGPRGRQGSAASVSLPEGWLDDPDDCTVPAGAEDDGSSGG